MTSPLPECQLGSRIQHHFAPCAPHAQHSMHRAGLHEIWCFCTTETVQATEQHKLWEAQRSCTEYTAIRTCMPRCVTFTSTPADRAPSEHLVSTQYQLDKVSTNMQASCACVRTRHDPSAPLSPPFDPLLRENSIPFSPHVHGCATVSLSPATPPTECHLLLRACAAANRTEHSCTVPRSTAVCILYP